MTPPTRANDQPRERLWHYGGERVSTEELLAVLIGSGIRATPATAIATTLIRQAGGITKLARARPAELATIPGIGSARAARIAAAFHLGRRALEAADCSASITSPADVFARLRPRVAGLCQEVFIVLALNARNIVIDELEVARGSLAGVEVHPREVFRPLIRQAAAAAIVAHNHPSGDPHPSEDDIALTHRLVRVGELVGIPVLDHIVIGSAAFTSIGELVALTPAM